MRRFQVKNGDDNKRPRQDDNVLCLCDDIKLARPGQKRNSSGNCLVNGRTNISAITIENEYIYKHVKGMNTGTRDRSTTLEQRSHCIYN